MAGINREEGGGAKKEKGEEKGMPDIKTRLFALHLPISW